MLYRFWFGWLCLVGENIGVGILYLVTSNGGCVIWVILLVKESLYLMTSLGLCAIHLRILVRLMICLLGIIKHTFVSVDMAMLSILVVLKVVYVSHVNCFIGI